MTGNLTYNLYILNLLLTCRMHPKIRQKKCWMKVNVTLLLIFTHFLVEAFHSRRCYQYTRCTTFSPETLEAAYQKACREGTTVSYRAKLEIIGHTGVGKTSLSHKLLGQTLPKEVKSTEGIATHWVNSRFSEDLLQTDRWIEASHDPDDVMKKFCKEVLTEHEKNSKSSEITQSQNPRSNITTSQRSEEYDSEGNNIEKSPDDSVTEHSEHPDIPKAPEKSPNTTSTSFKNDNSVNNIITPQKNIAKMSLKTRNHLLHLQGTKTEKPSDSMIDYSISLWDYGGHTEFLATHELFLNIDSTTLLLLDMSKPLNEAVNKDLRADANVGIPKTSKDFLCYWLNAIHVKTIEKENKNFQPNIALVLTHKASCTEQDLENFKTEILESIEIKPYSKYITKENIFPIDNKQGEESDFVKLRNAVFRMMKKQSSWKIPRPVKWLKLESDLLEKAKEDSTNHIKLHFAKKLAKMYGMDEADLKAFLKFHHTYGDFVYHSNSALEDIIVTNPQWLANMFKTLITAHEFIDQRSPSDAICKNLKEGIVSNESFERLWEEEDITFLTSLFQKFNLLLHAGLDAEGNKMFLVPCMLPASKLVIHETRPFHVMIEAYRSSHRKKQLHRIPVGTFHRLLSVCSRSWEICWKDHLSYTDASFQIEKDVRLALGLLPNESISAVIYCTKEKVDKSLIDLILRTRKQLEHCTNVLDLQPPEDFNLICPSAKPKDEPICCWLKIQMLKDEGISQGIFQSTDKCAIHGRGFSTELVPSLKNTAFSKYDL